MGETVRLVLAFDLEKAIRLSRDVRMFLELMMEI